MEIRKGYKKVFLPIEVPEGNYCSYDKNDIHVNCKFLSYAWLEWGHVECSLHLGHLCHNNDLQVEKPKACLKLQTKKVDK